MELIGGINEAWSDGHKRSRRQRMTSQIFKVSTVIEKGAGKWFCQHGHEANQKGGESGGDYADGVHYSPF
jgi:hypothetical protein